jgi:anti-anti-sigma factor
MDPGSERGAAVSSVADSPSSLAVATRRDQSAVILTVEGVLDPGNSAALRDTIVQATLDEPSGVIVNVSGLRVSAESAWSTLIGAHWQVRTKPDVPVVLVSSDRAVRDTITRKDVARFMPVYSTEKTAMKALGGLGGRTIRHANAELPANLTSLRESRRLIREWLTAWSQSALIPVALVIVNVFVENVLEHTGSVPMMRVETDGATATIAVSDGSSTAAVRLPSPEQGIDVSGLAIVSALSRAWGSAPTSSGKTVWAVIGPENQL